MHEHCWTITTLPTDRWPMLRSLVWHLGHRSPAWRTKVSLVTYSGVPVPADWTATAPIIPEYLVHSRWGVGVFLIIADNNDQFRTHPKCFILRHTSLNTFSTSFVRTCSYDRSTMTSYNSYRFTTEFRVGSLLDWGKKRIRVNMQNCSILHSY